MFINFLIFLWETEIEKKYVAFVGLRRNTATLNFIIYGFSPKPLPPIFAFKRKKTICYVKE